MCFAKTNQIFWDIDELVRAELPLQSKASQLLPLVKTYGTGCHLISVIASRILNKHGYIAEPRLVALYKETLDTQIPHYVVTIQVDDQTHILDFKRRVFATKQFGQYFLASPDTKADIQEDQWSKLNP